MSDIAALKELADACVPLDKALTSLSLVLPEGEPLDGIWEEVQTAWSAVASAQRKAVTATKVGATP